MDEPPCSPQSCSYSCSQCCSYPTGRVWSSPCVPGAARLWLPSKEPQLCPTPRCPRSAAAPHFCSCCQWLLSSCHHKANDVPISSWLCSREGLGWGRVKPNLLPAHTSGMRSKIPPGATLGALLVRKAIWKNFASPCCRHRNQIFLFLFFFLTRKGFFISMPPD